MSGWSTPPIQQLRSRLEAHRLYQSFHSLSQVRIFMESHVFAVWDFMSLAKSLQQQLTCVSLPWVPRGDAVIRRFINEIVLSEESDDLVVSDQTRVPYASHFEFYREAMLQVGADVRPIDSLMTELHAGTGWVKALEVCGGPAGALEFTKRTMQVVRSGQPHVVAAEFAFGREDVIPLMFRGMTHSLRSCPELELLRAYLERHIDLDEGHSQLATSIVDTLCDDSEQMRSEAQEAAARALNARIRLWDSVVERQTALVGRSADAESVVVPELVGA